MSKMRHIVLLILCLAALTATAQRRYSATERWEYRLASLGGFSTKDVEQKTDVLFGLHASQYTGSHHIVGLAAEGSWSAMFTDMPAVSFKPEGYGAGLQLVYEYQFSGFLLQTGLGVAFQRVNHAIGDTVIYTYDLTDSWAPAVDPITQDATFTLKHQFYDRTDMAQHIYGQLPIYAGHYILGPLGIGYFLLGAKINYAFWGNTTQRLTGTTTGLYERYIGIWEEMDNHGFRKDVPIERKGDKLNFQFDLMAHGEIGYEYTTSQNAYNYRKRRSESKDCRLRLAAFADFSVLDICPRTDNPFYETPLETIYDFPTYRMEHVFSTTDAKSYWVRNFFVGIKFSVLFGFQGQERCILCDPWRH